MSNQKRQRGNKAERRKKGVSGKPDGVVGYPGAYATGSETIATGGDRRRGLRCRSGGRSRLNIMSLQESLSREMLSLEEETLGVNRQEGVTEGKSVYLKQQQKERRFTVE